VFQMPAQFPYRVSEVFFCNSSRPKKPQKINNEEC
jgi:hypothetical protein